MVPGDIYNEIFKLEHQIDNIKYAYCSVYPWARSVTSQSLLGLDKVYQNIKLAEEEENLMIFYFLPYRITHPLVN